MTLENSKTKHYFKVPCIPQIIHSNDFITGFAEKSKLFNTFFAQQCSLIENSSILPTCIFPKLDKSLSTIYFSEEDQIDPNKAHGHTNISIWMIKLCGKEICKPIHTIFVSCMEEGILPLLWKLANVVPAHKKNDERSIKNYHPVSLLPIFWKIFECLLYNQRYSFFIENNLISLSQDFSRVILI